MSEQCEDLQFLICLILRPESSNLLLFLKAKYWLFGQSVATRCLAPQKPDSKMIDLGCDLPGFLRCKEGIIFASSYHENLCLPLGGYIRTEINKLGAFCF